MNAYGMDIAVTSAKTMDFKVYTNFDGAQDTTGTSGRYFHLADIALDFDGTPDFEAAIVFRNGFTGGTGANGGYTGLADGIYGGVNWLTSFDINNGVTPSYAYGGTDANGDAIPVAITSGASIGTISTPTKSAWTNDDGGFGNIYSFTVTLDSNITRPFNVLFGNATCGNDVLAGTVPTPEPGTMILLGTGLAGLIGFRRKKK